MNECSSELLYWLTLDSIRGIGLGAARILSLYKYFTSLETAWHADIRDLLMVPNIPKATIEAFTQIRNSYNIEHALLKLYESNTRAIPFFYDEYPEQCRALQNPPLILYYKGIWDPSWFERALAIVGTREASPLAIDITSRISYELSQAGFAIITGVARGVDTAAHKGALQNPNNRLVAVVANGPDQIIPASNKYLYKALENNGTIISEYPPGTLPEKGFFPARNRIIAALAQATIVTEAGVKSGALITAEDTIKLNKKVFCFSSQIWDSSYQQGCSYFIRKGKATLVTNTTDILEELGENSLISPNPLPPLTCPPTQAKLPLTDFKPPPTMQTTIVSDKIPQEKSLDDIIQSNNLSDNSKHIVQALWACPNHSTTLDNLVKTTKLPVNKINACILQLTLKKVVIKKQADIILNKE